MTTKITTKKRTTFAGHLTQGEMTASPVGEVREVEEEMQVAGSTMIEDSQRETSRKAIGEMMRMTIKKLEEVGSGSVVVAAEVEDRNNVRKGVEEVVVAVVAKEAEVITVMTMTHQKKLFTEKRQVIHKK